MTINRFVRQVVPSILLHLRDLEELISERVCNRITRPRLLGPAVRPGTEPARISPRNPSAEALVEGGGNARLRGRQRYRAVDSIGHTNRCFSRSSHSTDFSRAAQANVSFMLDGLKVSTKGSRIKSLFSMPALDSTSLAGVCRGCCHLAPGDNGTILEFKAASSARVPSTPYSFASETRGSGSWNTVLRPHPTSTQILTRSIWKTQVRLPLFTQLPRSLRTACPKIPI